MNEPSLREERDRLGHPMLDTPGEAENLTPEACISYRLY